jgi:hypothetical protein
MEVAESHLDLTFDKRQDASSTLFAAALVPLYGRYFSLTSAMLQS